MDKTALRTQMLQLRSLLKPKFLENSAKRMGGQIAALPAFRDADLVMLYHSFKNEAGTLPLLQYCFHTHKKVALPLVVKTAVPESEANSSTSQLELRAYLVPGPDVLRPGSMGIMEPDPLLCEPVDPALIDLVIVPGVAFDSTGGRIGYGKGCYDRFLPQLLDDVPIVGLAYDFQVLPRVPQESTDVRVDAIVTEKGILTMPHSKLQL